MGVTMRYRLTITVTEVPGQQWLPVGTVVYDNPNLTDRTLGPELYHLGWVDDRDWALPVEEIIAQCHRDYPDEISITAL
jgi:hypothetical protein